jgi:transcriptional regulator with PAS, ATPase and Fis domain
LEENFKQHDYSNFTFALISPDRDIAEAFTKITKASNINAYVELASCEDAINVACNLRDVTDVILSAGATIQHIENVVKPVVPLVTIHLTSYDIVRAFCRARDFSNEIAFISGENIKFEISEMACILNIEVHEYKFELNYEIEQIIVNIKNKGLKVVVGGPVAVQLAHEHGLIGIQVKWGEEATQKAIYEAIHIAEVRKAERMRSARLKVVFDTISQGIIVTDEQSEIITYNPAAENIFKIPSGEVLGKKAESVIPNTRIHYVLESGQSEIGALQDINNGIIATNSIPIELDGNRIGVVSTFEDITKIQQLEQKAREKIYKKGFVAKYNFEDILTTNKQMIELKNLTLLYSKTDAAVLIQGESGTGKELFAQSIHNTSKRCSGPFVAVNCAAIPENLLESELFGYEGGAFTGARKEGKQGLFELAHNGSVFLDEIGEISKSLQARLLRVIQEKEIMRIGGDRIIPVDIRIISATNRNLEKQIENGDFRQDLYYRLNVFNVKIPSLRERKEDIGVISTKLLKEFTSDSINHSEIVKEIKFLLISHDWPGNIRELNNIMERLSLMILQFNSNNYRDMLKQAMSVSDEEDDDNITLRISIKNGLKDAMKEVEKSVIDTMLIKCNYDKNKVADILKIGRTTLWRKLWQETL